MDVSKKPIKGKAKIVRVIDVGNFKSDYREGIPFRAVICGFDSPCVIVKSLNTGKIYKLYEPQIEMLKD